MKKSTFVLTVCIILITCAGQSQADSAGKLFGNLMTAKAAGEGVGDVMGAIGIADDATIIFGVGKYGLSQYTTMRGKLGIADPDGKDADVRLCIGGDIFYQLFDMTTDVDKPVDFALGGFFEYINFIGASLVQIGGRGVCSRHYIMSNNRELTPYGSVEFRIERVSWDDGSDTDLKFGLNAGVAYELGDHMNVYGELQLDGNTGVFFGLEYNIM